MARVSPVSRTPPARGGVLCGNQTARVSADLGRIALVESRPDRCIGNCVLAATGSALTSLVKSNDSEHLSYIGTNQHVYQSGLGRSALAEPTLDRGIRKNGVATTSNA